MSGSFVVKLVNHSLQECDRFCRNDPYYLLVVQIGPLLEQIEVMSHQSRLHEKEGKKPRSWVGPANNAQRAILG